MKTIDVLIYLLPINKIEKVYLVGDESDYYRIYLVQKSKRPIKINIKSNILERFKGFNNAQNISMGDLTKEMSPDVALKLLNHCKWEKEKPNTKTLNFVKLLLKIREFVSIKNKIEEKIPFLLWIKNQSERDDIIGDIAQDIISDSKIGVYMSYKELKNHILINQTNDWEINSFKDLNKKKGRVSPLLGLELAKLEYDLYRQKEKIKKYQLNNTEGYVYFIRQIDDHIGPIKIGRARNVEKRISQLQTSSPHNFEIIGVVESNDCIKLENTLHNKYIKNKINREWFNLNINETVEIIKKYNGLVNSKFKTFQ